MEDLTFDEFARFIREYWSVANPKQITEETQFERDLGLTGDDGNDLLSLVPRSITMGQFLNCHITQRDPLHQMFNLNHV
jgi:hypothetical protein